MEDEVKKRGHYADVFTCSFSELRNRLFAQALSNVTAKLNDYIKVNNLKLHFTRSEINTIFQDGNMEFVRNIANKAEAVHFIEKNLSLEKENILIAGNAIKTLRC